MKELAAAHSATGTVIVGPDSAAYVVSGKDHAVSRLPESFGSLTSAGGPVVQDAHVRTDLRRTLEDLPHMGEIGPC